MKTIRLVLTSLIVVVLFGCGAETTPEATSQPDVVTESESEERYDLQGVIVERDPIANTLKIDHEAIGDWMGAMTMTFPVRGADVQSLPDDGSAITATVHVDGTEYWVTDISAAGPAPEETGTTTEDMTEAGADPEE